MMKFKLISRMGLLFVVFLFISAESSVAGGLKSSEETNASVELGAYHLVNTSPEAISALNRRIQAGVEAGKITLERGAQAQNSWVSLQQYLANQSTEMHQLENKIMELADNARLKAARDLTRSAVERERTLIRVYLVLSKIANDEGVGAEELISTQQQNSSAHNEPAQGRSKVEIEFSSTDNLIKDLE